MAMKKVINALTDVAEAFRGEYVGSADGKFTLIVEGEEDTSALKNAYERTKEDLRATKTERDALKSAKEAAEQAAVIATGDVAAIKASYEGKLLAAENERKAEAKKAATAITEAKKVEVADKIAREISTVPLMMRDQLMKRLRVTLEDGVAVPMVLDKDGKASAISLDELKSEFLANKDFAPIIIASKAKGGGAGSNPPNGPMGQGAGGGDTTQQFSKMTDMERTEWYRRDPDGFKAASTAHKLATTSM